MIRTHVLMCIAGCKVWVWKWLTLKQWLALPHVTKAAVVTTACITCATVPAVLFLGTPGPVWDGGAPVERGHPVDVPEPAGWAVLAIGAGLIAWTKRHG